MLLRFCTWFQDTSFSTGIRESVWKMCIRDSGHSFGEILGAYPYLEEEDIRQALAYAAWRVEEIEVPLPAA